MTEEGTLTTDRMMDLGMAIGDAVDGSAIQELHDNTGPNGGD